MPENNVNQPQKNNLIEKLTLTSIIIGASGLLIGIIGVLLFLIGEKDFSNSMMDILPWVFIACGICALGFAIFNIIRGVIFIKKPLIWKFSGKKYGIILITIFCFCIFVALLEVLFIFIFDFDWAKDAAYIFCGIFALIVLAFVILDTIIFIKIRKNKK